ncbi:pik3r4 kinase-related protein (incomplete catalytic triad) [Cyclospora cayetanensis]|uniref:non-specific serine/threonine protein kinase n=1 Tax=Cyclospora cayetanensis TaxID=88456 RepID=A0A1D3CTW7_9EIME|nr:pik3r4 kinase-related protein (incomplete catalytic triad) [Cyclospora cayetanensis]
MSIWESSYNATVLGKRPAVDVLEELEERKLRLYDELFRQRGEDSGPSAAAVAEAGGTAVASEGGVSSWGGDCSTPLSPVYPLWQTVSPILGPPEVPTELFASEAASAAAVSVSLDLAIPVQLLPAGAATSEERAVEAREGGETPCAGCMRSGATILATEIIGLALQHTSSPRIRACGISLLRFLSRIATTEVLLESLLPFLTHHLGDPLPVVRAAAVKALAAALLQLNAALHHEAACSRLRLQRRLCAFCGSACGSQNPLPRGEEDAACSGFLRAGVPTADPDPAVRVAVTETLPLMLLAVRACLHFQAVLRSRREQQGRQQLLQRLQGGSAAAPTEPPAAPLPASCRIATAAREGERRAPSAVLPRKSFSAGNATRLCAPALPGNAAGAASPPADSAKNSESNQKSFRQVAVAAGEAPGGFSAAAELPERRSPAGVRVACRREGLSEAAEQHLMEAVEQLHAAVLPTLQQQLTCRPLEQRLALLRSVPLLAAVLGPQKTHSFLLPYLIVQLNDTCAAVRAAVIRSLGSLGSFALPGSAESCIVPCCEQCLLDQQEEVIVAAVTALAQLAADDLLRPSSRGTYALLGRRVVPLLLFPSLLLRGVLLHLLAAIQKSWGPVQTYALLMPLLHPVLRRHSDDVLLVEQVSAFLRPPLSRQLLLGLLHQQMRGRLSEQALALLFSTPALKAAETSVLLNLEKAAGASVAPVHYGVSPVQRPRDRSNEDGSLVTAVHYPIGSAVETLGFLDATLDTAAQLQASANGDSRPLCCSVYFKQAEKALRYMLPQGPPCRQVLSAMRLAPTPPNTSPLTRVSLWGLLSETLLPHVMQLVLRHQLLLLQRCLFPEEARATVVSTHSTPNNIKEGGGCKTTQSLEPPQLSLAHTLHGMCPAEVSSAAAKSATRAALAAASAIAGALGRYLWTYPPQPSLLQALLGLSTHHNKHSSSLSIQASCGPPVVSGAYLALLLAATTPAAAVAALTAEVPGSSGALAPLKQRLPLSAPPLSPYRGSITSTGVPPPLQRDWRCVVLGLPRRPSLEVGRLQRLDEGLFSLYPYQQRLTDSVDAFPSAERRHSTLARRLSTGPSTPPPHPAAVAAAALGGSQATLLANGSGSAAAAGAASVRLSGKPAWRTVSTVVGGLTADSSGVQLLPVALGSTASSRMGRALPAGLQDWAATQQAIGTNLDRKGASIFSGNGIAGLPDLSCWKPKGLWLRSFNDFEALCCRGGGVLSLAATDDGRLLCAAPLALRGGEIRVWKAVSLLAATRRVAAARASTAAAAAGGNGIACLCHQDTALEQLLLYALRNGLFGGWDLRTASPCFAAHLPPWFGAPSAEAIGLDARCAVVGTTGGLLLHYDLRMQVPVSAWLLQPAAPIKHLLFVDPSVAAISVGSAKIAAGIGSPCLQPDDTPTCCLVVLLEQGAFPLLLLDLQDGSVVRGYNTSCFADAAIKAAAAEAGALGAAQGCAVPRLVPVPMEALRMPSAASHLLPQNAGLAGSLRRVADRAALHTPCCLWSPSPLRGPTGFVLTAGEDRWPPNACGCRAREDSAFSLMASLTVEGTHVLQQVCSRSAQGKRFMQFVAAAAAGRGPGNLGALAEKDPPCTRARSSADSEAGGYSGSPSGGAGDSRRNGKGLVTIDGTSCRAPGGGCCCVSPSSRSTISSWAPAWIPEDASDAFIGFRGPSPMHRDAITGLAVIGQSDLFLATAGRDGIVKIWS